jgi:PST family polysaccharide transporter
MLQPALQATRRTRKATPRSRTVPFRVSGLFKARLPPANMDTFTWLEPPGQLTTRSGDRMLSRLVVFRGSMTKTPRVAPHRAPGRGERPVPAVASRPAFALLRRIARILSRMAATQVVITASGILRNKVLAGTLGTHLFGVFSQVVAAANLFNLSAQLGIALALNRNIAATSDRDERQALLACANFLTAVASIVTITAAVLMVASGLASSLFGLAGEPHLVWLLVVLVAFCPFEAWRVTLFGVLQGMLDVKGMSLQRAGAVAVVTLASFPVVLRYGIHGAVAQIALLSIAVGAVHARRLVRLGFEPIRLAFQAPIAGRLLRYGVAALLMDLALNATDVFIRSAIAHRLGYSDIGFYQVAFALSVNVKLVVLGSLSSIAIADLNARLDMETLFERSGKLLGAILPITNLALGVLVLTSPLLVRILYTEDYLAAVPLVGPIAVGDYMQTLNRVLGAPMLALGRVRLWLGIGVIYVAVRVLVTFGLLPSLHLLAVPIGYAVGMTSVTLLYYAFYRRACGLRLSSRVRLRLVAGALAIVGATVLLDDQSAASRCLAAGPVVAILAWDFMELGLAAKLRARLARLTRS